ncbi:conserved exported hypothetical protein [Gammaproteobacteria bacterium]
MSNQSAMAVGILLAFAGASMFTQTAQADFFNMMNPSKWFNNNDRRYDDYYDRDRYSYRDRYGPWGGYYGPGYGPGWGGYGYPGYPGYSVVQPATKESPPPPVPQ